jgi:hypothetical protein
MGVFILVSRNRKIRTDVENTSPPHSRLKNIAPIEVRPQTFAYFFGDADVGPSGN